MEDNPPVNVGGGVKLVDSKIWKVRVIAPSVKGLKASIKPATSNALLTWNSYACALPNAKIIVFENNLPVIL